MDWICMIMVLALYHEMNADIKNGSGNGSKDHEAYGNYTGGLKLHYDQVIDRSGNWDVVTHPAWDVKKRTPYYRIRQQLLILKRAE